jgi:hypothetical protein
VAGRPTQVGTTGAVKTPLHGKPSPTAARCAPGNIRLWDSWGLFCLM